MFERQTVSADALQAIGLHENKGEFTPGLTGHPFFSQETDGQDHD
jgi:hypothetical protein